MNIQSLDQAARDILRANDKGSYTIPTGGLYPYQWNWNSAFAAMGFAQFDVDRAWVELETLLSGQWDNGMVPHILFHTVDPGYFPGPEVWGCPGPIASSGISQPPTAATMAKLVFNQNPAVGMRRIEPLFDKLLAWHRWFIHGVLIAARCVLPIHGKLAETMRRIGMMPWLPLIRLVLGRIPAEILAMWIAPCARPNPRHPEL